MPFHLDTLPELLNALGLSLIPTQLPLQVPPEVLNGIEVRRLCRPYHLMYGIVLEPFLGLLALVLGVVVLLEDDIALLHIPSVKAPKQIILQNLLVKLPIHVSINPDNTPNPRTMLHASPHHDIAATVFHRFASGACSEPFTRPFPYPLVAIGPKTINLGLI